ncbi:hypothetical protein NQ176_g1835 [Zarea fungicola]|uniref:Uncharacterized protein n=1 Tax=Zarea fungicola TaxID=93591 RepID=A0ACC1NR01_9HYPO|nr:hypothetical protein NQ176_g1835 [Lecanicillium fungicola]
MLLRFSVCTVLCAIILAVYYRPQPQSPTQFNVRGTRNKTALFIVTEHHGYSNVHLATAQSILERYPDIQIHFASFPALSSKIADISSATKRRQPLARDVVFHHLHGRSYMEAILQELKLIGLGIRDDGSAGTLAKPGIEGLDKLAQIMEYAFSPWTPEEQLAIHDQITSIIAEIDPATIVLDTIFSPAIEATRGRNRSHVIITPNTLSDTFVALQPYGGMFGSIPRSGYPFPVPWHLVPRNAYLSFKLIYSFLKMRSIAAKRSFLQAHGVVNPLDFFHIQHNDVPWITQTMPEASTPMDFVPANVTCAGPITLSPSRAQDIDAEIVSWMKQKPTVLVNLGTAVVYSAKQTMEMIGAIAQVLEHSDVQVLWKYKIADEIASDFDWRAAMKQITYTGRVMVNTWLTIDPPTLLQSGFITAFVTHGGAGGFHESLEAGVPTVVLPPWADCFNLAQLTEQLGVGHWGCREISPDFEPQCLSKAILGLLDDTPETVAMRARVKKLSEMAKQAPGRDKAADIVAKMAVL